MTLERIQRIHALPLELNQAIGQLMGRAEWLGRDFVALLSSRLSQLEALAIAEPGSPAVREFEALRPRIETSLSALVVLVPQASSIFDSLIEEARSVLDGLPKAN